MMMRPICYKPRTPKSRLIFLKAARKCSDKPAFQFHQNGSDVTFEDMKQAHELLWDFPNEHREDMYASLFNIDSKAMDKYYGRVLLLEKSYQEAADQERKKKSIRIKLGLFYIYICRN